MTSWKRIAGLIKGGREGELNRLKAEAEVIYHKAEGVESVGALTKDDVINLMVSFYIDQWKKENR